MDIQSENPSFEIPNIYLKYIDAFVYKSSANINNIKNHANIAMKSKNWLWENYENDEDYLCYKNQNGCIREYDKNANFDEIYSVNIKCEDYCGNCIIGDLLQNIYPNLNTIYIHRYRGYSSNISHSLNLQIENLICYGSQGYDFALEFVKRIPNLKWLLFDEYDLFLTDEIGYKNLNLKRSNGSEIMKEINMNPLMLNTNENTKLEGMMFLIDRFRGDYESKIVDNGFLDSNKTWTESTVTIKRNKHFEEWVVYRKVK